MNGPFLRGCYPCRAEHKSWCNVSTKFCPIYTAWQLLVAWCGINAVHSFPASVPVVTCVDTATWGAPVRTLWWKVSLQCPRSIFLLFWVGGIALQKSVPVKGLTFSSLHLSSSLSLRGHPSGSHFLFFLDPLLGGMSCICLVGRLEGGGTWIGINCAEIRKTSPGVQGCAVNPIKIKTKSSCNESFHYLSICCTLS